MGGLDGRAEDAPRLRDKRELDDSLSDIGYGRGKIKWLGVAAVCCGQLDTRLLTRAVKPRLNGLNGSNGPDVSNGVVLGYRL